MNRTKQIIYDSAINVFSNNGYNGATMDEISSNAGISKGTLYYHFKSKEEIFKYIISEGMKKMKEEIDNAASNVDEPCEKLKIVFRTQINIARENSNFFKAIVSKFWGKEIRELSFINLMNDYINYIQGFINLAIEAGEVKKGNSRLKSYLFLGIMSFSSLYEILETDADIDSIADNAVQYIINGIGTEKEL